MSRKKIVLVAVLVVAVVAALGVSQFLPTKSEVSSSSPNSSGAAPVSVEAVTPTLGNMNRTIEAVGTLISDESVVLSPELAGRVSAISFGEGEQVSAGQPLIQLDASVYKAELDAARASHILSVANHNRAERLFKAGSGTERARDESLSAMNADKARLDLAHARLGKMTIVAPFDGVAGLRHVSLGDYVTPGQPLTNIEKIDTVKVDFRIPEVYLNAIASGQKINVSVDAFPGQLFDGEVFAINPRIDESGRSIILRARLDNPGMVLRPGLFARVRLIVESKSDAILVPEQALWPMGNQQTVFKVVNGTPIQTPVSTGLRRDGMVEIVDGVSAIDEIITAGQMKLRPNSTVTIINTVEQGQGN